MLNAPINFWNDGLKRFLYSDYFHNMNLHNL